MTPADLRNLLGKLEADRLLTTPAISFWMAGNEVKDTAACLAYCERHGLLCKVERGGVTKWYRDAPPTQDNAPAPAPPPPLPKPMIPLTPPRPKKSPQPITSQPRLL